MKDIYLFLALTLLINNNHSYKIRFKKVSVFVAGVMITMLPWLIRNYIVFDRVVVLTDRTSGFTNKFFSYSDSIGYFAEYDIEHNVNRDLKWEPYMLDEIKDGNDIYGMSPKRLRSIRQGIKYNIVPRQYTYIEGKYYEFKELWIPFRIKPEFRQTGFKFEKPWSLKHNLSQGLTYGLLLPLFIIGIAGIIKYRNKYGIIMLCIIASNTIIHVFLAWARQRYRIPIDSFIIITAFYGLKYSYDFILIKAKGKIK